MESKSKPSVNDDNSVKFNVDSSTSTKKPGKQDYLRPGDDDEDSLEDAENGLEQAKSLNRWHDFESQYSLAMDQSVVMEREAWGSQLEFLMSCIASAVGLGNIWRFPFICAQNGGGAFFVPYMIVLFIVGRPMYMMELGLGQFTSGGPVKVWEMVPGFRGVGYMATLASFFLASFYMCLMGWSLLFMVYSCFPKLPWNEEVVWMPGLENVTVHQKPGPFFGLAHLGEPDVGKFNMTFGRKEPKLVADNQFFRGEGLDGPPVIHVALGLALAWMIIWGNLIGGVSGSGKIAYFTALFPYVVLIVLLLGGITLKGASTGLALLFRPDWSKILKGQAWFQAVGQCFFSLGISFGGCFMFASYNDFHHKLGRDILIISIMDTFTSLLAGTCLFALLGHLDWTHRHDKDIRATENVKEYANSAGAGLAFVVFPNVLTAFGSYPFPNIFSFLFFFMIVTLAVGSANGIVGTIVVVICDAFPRWSKKIVVTALCCACFAVGMIYTFRTGNNVIDIVDKYGTEGLAFVIAIFEAIGIFYVYGLKNLCNDFEFMLGHKMSYYWVFSWAVLPFILIAIFITYYVTWTNEKAHPPIAVYAGFALTFVSSCVFPAMLAATIYTRKSRSFKNKVRSSFHPTRRWGPREPAIREAWRRWKRTKPTEFRWTVNVLRFLGIRKSLPAGTQAYWSADKAASSLYQAPQGEGAESTTVLTPTKGKASPPPTAAKTT